ncbi:MAG: zinc ribbon domain-containing protein [Ignavibacteriaceae bacterium]|nr:zinc ribbon domain-containing protein [Ignavibacteriaceae bacterium]
MPVCPNCEYEYTEGVTFCPDCQTQLLDDKYYTKPEDWTEENWVLAFTTNMEYEAEMMRDNLLGAEIKAAVLSQKDRSFPGSGDLSVVKLFVRKEDLASALAFIEKIKSEQTGEDDDQ